MPTQITPAVLAGVYQNFNTRFQAGLTSAPIWWNKLAMQIPSATAEELYAWMQKIPKMRQWVGNRVMNRLAADAYRLVNSDWEDSVAVEKNKIEDDRLAIFGKMFEMMGLQAGKWPDQQCTLLLKNFATNLCYDGLPFFDDNHPIDMNDSAAGVYDNNFTATALTGPNFDTVYAAMQGYKGQDGEPLGLIPDTLFVPPALRGTASVIVKAETIGVITGGTYAASQTNINKGVVELVVVPELAGQDTTWYLAVTSLPIKPLIYQLRQAPNFVSRTSPDSDNVFERKEYQYGADARAAFGYSLPFLMARAIA
jgi:phage major head subunit gpT-like protein